MDITVYGSGYVGLVVAACFAQSGNQVVCMDVDKDKIAQLNQGKVPIYEPGLADIIQAHQENIRFTNDAAFAAQHGKVQFIAVGTPGDATGKVDLRYVEAVAKIIAEHIQDYTIVVNKSTVPIGAATQVKEWIQAGLAQRGKSVDFEVVSNPEFLREGCALKDFTQPDRIVIGAETEQARNILQVLYAPFDIDNTRLMFMGVRSAELCKYAANAFLATKISFINQVANLAEQVDADIDEVRQGLGRDTRIGPEFLQAGCGYGGSCFGKDTQALLQIGQEKQIDLGIIAAAEAANAKQKHRVVEKLQNLLGSQLKGQVVAIWGLSFKPGTDDLRDAPSLNVIPALHQLGCITQLYDPKAMPKAQKVFAPSSQCIYSNDKLQALEGAKALLILTEWSEFKQADLGAIKQALVNPIVIDGRNIFEPKQMLKLGFAYYGIGRGLCSKIPSICD